VRKLHKVMKFLARRQVSIQSGDDRGADDNDQQDRQQGSFKILEPDAPTFVGDMQQRQLAIRVALVTRCALEGHAHYELRRSRLLAWT